jgi:acyl-CoA synthetase (AMP-forming)/AMP-acid ligase II
MTTQPGQDAEIFGEPASDTNKSYWDLFSETAAKYPNNEAVVSLWQRDWNGHDQVLRWSYSDILKHSAHVATWLKGRGCHEGMSLAAFLGNSAEWTLFMWVAASMDLTFVPLNPLGLKNDGKLFIEATSPTVVVVEDEEAAKMFDDVARHGLRDTAVCISCSEESIPGWHSLSQIMTTAGAESEHPHSTSSSGNDGVSNSEKLIFFTSGTTGTPKACPLTSTNVWSQTWDFEPPSWGFDRFLVHTPVSHILGWNHATRMFRSGGTIVFSGKRFDPATTLVALRQEKCTKMAAVPTLVRVLLANDEFKSKEELALKYITLGGTIITPEDIRLCKEGLGVETAVQGYGLTEGMPITSWHSCDPLLVKRYV